MWGGELDSTDDSESESLESELQWDLGDAWALGREESYWRGERGEVTSDRVIRR